MVDAVPNSYDWLPYPSLSYVQTHPDRLATVATLMGMDPAPVGRCRVMELGCAGGWNLIPMAYALPGSEFLGIDNSGTEIAEGQAQVAALELGNITLRQLDILDAGPDLGQFDYIIAHGVYSWVPPQVQDAVLRICQQNLAPNGVAYVSYNTYPGWHMLTIVRDMMLYHTRHMSDLQERAAGARALLDFLAEAVPEESGAYGSFLNSYAEYLRGEVKGENAMGDSFLVHDELEEVNEPLYFYQFAQRAMSHGLRYLGETEFRTMMDGNLPPKTSGRLREMSGSVVDLEQYMDFLRNQTFRKTLLCHQEVPLSRALKGERLEHLYVASHAQPVGPEPDIHSVSPTQYRGGDGAVITTDHPLTKAAMLHLADIWPRAISLEALRAAARIRLGHSATAAGSNGQAEAEARVLNTSLLRAYTYSDSLVELHAFQPQIVLEVSERPVVSPVARRQAEGGTKVTNQRHERVELDEVNLYLLPLLDGQHDRGDLVRALETGPVAEGLLVIRQDGQPVEDKGKLRELLADSVGRRLAWLGRAGLLIG